MGRGRSKRKIPHVNAGGILVSEINRVKQILP